jgi:hypothetical protein
LPPVKSYSLSSTAMANTSTASTPAPVSQLSSATSEYNGRPLRIGKGTNSRYKDFVCS